MHLREENCIIFWKFSTDFNYHNGSAWKPQVTAEHSILSQITHKTLQEELGNSSFLQIIASQMMAEQYLKHTQQLGRSLYWFEWNTVRQSRCVLSAAATGCRGTAQVPTLSRQMTIPSWRQICTNYCSAVLSTTCMSWLSWTSLISRHHWSPQGTSALHQPCRETSYQVLCGQRHAMVKRKNC